MKIKGTSSTYGFTRLGVPTGELRICTAGTVVSVDPAGAERRLSIEFGFSGSSYH